jgi:hypothetical protein
MPPLPPFLVSSGSELMVEAIDFQEMIATVKIFILSGMACDALVTLKRFVSIFQKLYIGYSNQPALQNSHCRQISLVGQGGSSLQERGCV